MKIIDAKIPEDTKISLPKNIAPKKKDNRFSKSTLFSVAAVILLSFAVAIVFALNSSSKSVNYNTGKINEDTVSTIPTESLSPTTSVSTVVAATANPSATKPPVITTIVPTQIPYGQMKDLVDNTKTETNWVSPSLSKFNWIDGCPNSQTTSEINGSLIQTTIDFTKSGADKTDQDIQSYFQNQNWASDSCNSSNTSVKQIRAYKNKSTNKRIIVTDDSQYIDSPDPNYPPSGKKVSETVTVQYE